MTGEETTVKFITIDEVENAPDLEPIWGNWLFRDSVVLQAGEPGVAKTTFNFSFSKAVVDEQPFLEIKPITKDTKILYLEFEASASLVKSRMKAMGDYPINSQNFLLYIRDEDFHSLNQINEALKQVNFKPDIIFADPIRLAFNMRDENDNAEGTRQMKIAKSIARGHNCCVVLVHHSSKAELTGTKKSCGASSRGALADVVMNFDKLYDSEGKEISRDLFALTIPKNRMIDDDFCVCVKKVADGRKFRIVDFPEGCKFSVDGLGSATGRYTVQNIVNSEILAGGVSLTSKSISEALGRLGKECSEQMLYRVLSNLIALNVVETVGEGRGRYYRKTIKKIELKSSIDVLHNEEKM